MAALRQAVSAISIHALLAESDVVHALELADAMLFLSTLSLRRATSADCNCRSARPDFYPRSPCGERRDFGASHPKNNQISIHALLAESDSVKPSVC